jgi:hypothetical protein
MNVATVHQAARHECGHAAALAARTGILTESIYVGCKLDGTCAAGINGNGKIPIQSGTLADWIIYNLAGYATEMEFDPTEAIREGALRDDIVVEKILRANCAPETWILAVEMIEAETAMLVQNHRACINEMATALLLQTPRAVAVFGTNRHVYKLGADEIREILTKHGLQTPHRFECDYTDEQFERLLQRHALNVRIGEASPILAAEFYNHRRFAEGKRLATLDFLNHQDWVDNYRGAKVEVLDW